MDYLLLSQTVRITMDQINFLKKLIPLFINNIRNNKELPVYGDGYTEIALCS